MSFGHGRTACGTPSSSMPWIYPRSEHIPSRVIVRALAPAPRVRRLGSTTRPETGSLLGAHQVRACNDRELEEFDEGRRCSWA
jgi:hypothetical protein